ncbi:hypothetical protein DMN91_011414 [Ooceraea biroi]|uniref:Uncharacterized protein n=1 Tax=Ooceraea biroi TaxID=2015173 RepID=A0A3L8D5I3_OOCBI|nr:hypothetical protein DMN91_011414 [Ooceraea biroi]
MRNRLCNFIYVLLLLKALQPPISHAKVINAPRTKREVSVPEISNPKHLQRSNIDKSIDYDNVASCMQRLDEESADDGQETGKNMAKDKEAGDVVRLPRDVNADLDKYTDQDEKSSLYDDYEAKDVAKRGILGSPEDYEEEDDDSSNVIEDMVAMKEQGLLDEGIIEKRAAQGDARVKRDQSVPETLDKSESSLNDPAKLEESKIAAKDPQSRQVSRVESLASNGTSKIKGSNEMISGSSGASNIDQATNAVAPLKRAESNDVEYEKRVEEEIQRKIDSIKEEIQRDIEVYRRINDIEENNARFEEELRDQEREERQNSEGEPIEKRQTVAKRSIRGNDNDGVSPSKSSEKRALKGDQHVRELRRRSSEIGKSDVLKKRLSRRGDIKKRATANHDEVSGRLSSKELFKKKRDRTRQTFLVNNDHHRSKRRRSRSYASPLDRTGVRPENELLITDQDLNSYTDNRMNQIPLPIASEGESNEEKPSPAVAGRPNSLVSITESSQDLSPRLAREYKEAFGGLQSEPGSALARFKRIKRVLGGFDAKI